MTIAIRAIQQALVAKLTGDALLMDTITGVYDTVPQQAVLPYLEIDLVAQELVPSVGENLWRVNVALNVWTAANSRKAALTTLDRLHTILHHGVMSISGFTLHEMEVQTASCELTSGAQQLVGTMEITLLVVAT